MRRKKAEMKKRGLRMAPRKVKKKELYCLPSTRIVSLFFIYYYFLILLCDLNM